MTPLLEIESLSVHFPQPRTLLDLARGQAKPPLRAVQEVSLAVAPGETLGLVGESGCGKSTLGRAIIDLVPHAAGSVRFKGRDIAALKGEARLAFCRAAQMIFQDPFSSLNPKMTAGQSLAEVLKVHGLCGREDMPRRIAELLDSVGLSPELAARRPRALSGGQCQRVGIARALAVGPELIIADESVAALDVSIQAQLLNLFLRLQRERHLTMIFISHDLEVVRHVCQRLAVMYLGRIVETGPTAEIFADPKHPYTRALLSARPRMSGGDLRETALLAGEPPSPLDLPRGCPFHPRCDEAMAACRQDPPPAQRRLGAVATACHLYGKEEEQARAAAS